MSDRTISLRAAAQRAREADIDTLARTLYGEARGESLRGIEAVASVVMNRVVRAKAGESRWWGTSVQEVCRAPFQFSCWNATDPNRRLILNVAPGDRVFDMCRRIARRAVAGALDDPTKGATHYHALNVKPAWAEGRRPCVVIGRHMFYNDVR